MSKASARAQTRFVCQSCGESFLRWEGQCRACSAWNSLVETHVRAEPRPSRLNAGGGLAAAASTRLIDVREPERQRVPVGIGELDRVLGGGLVPGSVALLGGEPGIGKSTLLLQALSSLARGGARCLLVSAEESKEQVRKRARRLGALEPALWLVSETSLPGVVAAIDEVRPDVVAVDSIQTVADPDLGTGPGSVTQVRECAQSLVALAKQGG